MTPEEFWSILHQPVEHKEFIYRLYYNDQGYPLYYAAEDLPGNYIEVDRETYAAAPINIRVVDDKIKVIRHVVSSKLKPGDNGTPCHVHNVSIVVNDTAPHTKWSLTTYESD